MFWVILTFAVLLSISIVIIAAVAVPQLRQERAQLLTPRGEELRVLASERVELIAEQKVRADIDGAAQPLRSHLGRHRIHDEKRIDGDSTRARSTRSEDPHGDKQLAVVREAPAREADEGAAQVRLAEGELERLARGI